MNYEDENIIFQDLNNFDNICREKLDNIDEKDILKKIKGISKTLYEEKKEIEDKYLNQNENIFLDNEKMNKIKDLSKKILETQKLNYSNLNGNKNENFKEIKILLPSNHNTSIICSIPNYEKYIKNKD